MWRRILGSLGSTDGGLFPGYGWTTASTLVRVRDLYLANDGHLLRVRPGDADIWEMTMNDACPAAHTGLTATAGQRRK